MEFISIPVIVVLCYFIGEVSKLFLGKKESNYKFIPIIVGVSGGVFGLIAYYLYPKVMTNINDPFVAIITGIISGLASTGGNQVVKQLIKKTTNPTEEHEESKEK